MEEQKSFLEKLQSADEETKKRWLVISVAVIMVIVIYVWLAYFNNLLAGFSAPPASESGSGEAQGGMTFWQTLKNGAASVYDGFIGKISALGNILQAPREYIIKPPR